MSRFVGLPFLILFLVPYLSLAQGTPGKCYINIKAKSVYAGVNEDGGTDEFTWIVGANDQPGQCVAIDGESNWFPVNKALVTNASVDLISNIEVTLDAWEDDAGSRCIYNASDFWDNGGDGDDNRCTLTLPPLDIINYPPGATNSTTRYCDTRWGVQFEFSYSPPVPNAPTITRSVSGPACPTETITLSTNNYINSTFQSSVTMTWEYRIPKVIQYEGEVPNPAYCGDIPGACDGGVIQMAAVKAVADQFSPMAIVPGTDLPPCCSEPPTIPGTITDDVGTPWTTIGTTTGSNSLPVALSSLDLRTLEYPSSAIIFRVKASAGGLTGGYSPTSSLDVSPLAPTITSMYANPSCKSSGTGEIVLETVKGTTNNYMVIAIKNGDPSGVTQSFSGTSTTITGLAAGNYDVDIYNGSTAACANHYPAYIPLHTALSFSSTPSVSQNVSCQDGSDGKITVSTNGGKPSTDITFTISPSAGSFVRTAANAGEFQGLPAGAYTISATDNCMDPISSGTITVSQPTRVTASVATSNPTCTNPYNGVLSVSNTSNGSGTYDYHLYKDGVEVRSSLGTSTTAWNLTDLPPGSYNLDIRDSSRPTCDGYTSNFVLAAVTPLGSTFTSNDVTCFLAGDGKISLTGSGGSGSYKFTALNTTTSQSFSNTTGSFSSLSPGNYTATIQNNNACGDSYSNTNIIIKEPDDISFTLAAKKITCNGDDNGKITATVSGGNGSFNYQWEYSDGSGWKNYNLAGGTTAVIDNLFPADYRLKVSDLKNCSKTSSVVSIVDPKPLTISSALPVHVTCKGLTDGNIQVTAADGWGGYSYQYSANGTSYSSAELTMN